ncbi:putative quinol monooxygenase [Streptomyces coelicoflavus]|uniref:putative quinol monooxygenase n=1 Tax=Streptomyces coelicoflavus TaxID=285562 RepID=UPI001EF22867|nr:antibiotic biosynthesis monooxygenase family protein [Streptomyces coelicoflavus]
MMVPRTSGSDEGGMDMAYGYIGSMRTQPGKRDDVVAILLSGADSLRELGCRSYVVGLANDEPDTIVVTEVWESKDHHDASLRLPEAKGSDRCRDAHAHRRVHQSRTGCRRRPRRWWLTHHGVSRRTTAATWSAAR